MKQGKFDETSNTEILSGMYEPFREHVVKELMKGDRDVTKVAVYPMTMIEEGIKFAINPPIPVSMPGRAPVTVELIYWDSDLKHYPTTAGITKHVFSYDTRYIVSSRKKSYGRGIFKEAWEVYTQDDPDLVKNELSKVFGDEGITVPID